MTTPTPRSELIEAALREIGESLEAYLRCGVLYGTSTRAKQVTLDLIRKHIEALSTPSAVAPTNAPYPNCKYQICDLPGQCEGEGRCHHPIGGRDSAVGAPVVEGQPYAWVRTLNGKLDWGDDCLCEHGQQADLCDGYDKDNPDFVYEAIPLYTHPPIPPAPVDLGEVERLIQEFDDAACASSHDVMSESKGQRATEARTALLSALTRFAGGKDRTIPQWLIRGMGGEGPPQWKLCGSDTELRAAYLELVEGDAKSVHRAEEADEFIDALKDQSEWGQEGTRFEWRFEIDGVEVTLLKPDACLSTNGEAA